MTDFMLAAARINQIICETTSSVKERDRILITAVETYARARGAETKGGTPLLFAQYVYEMVTARLRHDAIRPDEQSTQDKSAIN